MLSQAQSKQKIHLVQQFLHDKFNLIDGHFTLPYFLHKIHLSAKTGWTILMTYKKLLLLRMYMLRVYKQNVPDSIFSFYIIIQNLFIRILN